MSNFVYYCTHCRVSISSLNCPRCGRLTEKTLHKNARRPRHSEAHDYIGGYDLSRGDLREVTRTQRRASVGYSED